MKKFIISIIAVTGLLGIVAVAPAYVDTASASPKSAIQDGVSDIDIGGGNSDIGPKVKIVINILMYGLGVIAVIMIIVGGIRYTTSGGDASGIKSARDTILYAVVGLVVAILSYAIVNFVLKAF
jgi:hypothetical protein